MAAIDGHLNHVYYTDGDGDNVPICSRDRYSSQDIGRDFWYNLDQVGLTLRALMPSFPFLFSGGIVTQGAGDTLNITAAKGLVEADIEYPTSFTTTPPTTATRQITVKVNSTTQTNMAIASATLDGITTNYVKLAYVETNGPQTRIRAYGSGNYAYTREPSFSITVNSTPGTDKEVVLDTFTGLPAGAFAFSQSQSSKALFGSAPIGAIVAWHKNLAGTPPLPSNWVEMNGQLINDADSTYNGVTLEDLNGDKRFLRGSATSGILEADAFQGHFHGMTNNTNVWHNNSAFVYPTPTPGVWMNKATLTVTGPITDGVNGAPRTASETKPINISMVWVLRIK